MKCISDVINSLPRACNIQLITRERVALILENSELSTNFGKFIQAKSPTRILAIDNIDGNAWTEEFRSIRHAISWLMGNFEVTDSPSMKYQRTEKYFRHHC